MHYRLAELSSEVESLRALVYRATELYVGGKDVTRLASMAKLKAGRLAREVADSCLQFWGGMGFMWETRIARLYRDARLVSIGGGARRDHAEHHLQTRRHPAEEEEKPDAMTALLPATETLDLAARDGVLHVTLARAEVRNAMSARMVKELQAVLAAVAHDRSVRAWCCAAAGALLRRR